MARTCLRCGGDLPAWASPSVSYCVACRKKIHNEALARQYAEWVKRQANKQETRDRAYCKDCRYHSGTYGENLCDYILSTGKRRGCKAGEGCERRVIVGLEKGSEGGAESVSSREKKAGRK